MRNAAPLAVVAIMATLAADIRGWPGRLSGGSLWFALLVVMVAAVRAEATPFAYVTTDSSTVSVIDTATNTEVATVSLGLPARGVGITPNGALAYVTDRLYTPFCDDFSGFCYGAWSSSIIDTATETVVGSVLLTTCGPEQQSACPPPEPGSVAITPDGAFAYMTKYETGYSVSVVDTAANYPVAWVWMGNATPFGVAVSPDGGVAYVTADGVGPGGFVAVIDTATKTLTTTVAVGLAPRGVAFTPNSRFAYVANSDSDSVAVIATATNTVVGTVPMPVGSSPFDVAITPDGAFAYVTNRGSNTVSVIATATNTVVGTVPGLSDPDSVAITPDGAFAYVANYGSNTVSVIATATQTVVAAVPVEAPPTGVATTPPKNGGGICNSRPICQSIVLGQISLYGGNAAGLAIDSEGVLYVAENVNPNGPATVGPAVRKVSPAGISQYVTHPGDLGDVSALAVDPDGNLYIADGNGMGAGQPAPRNQVLKLTRDGQLTVFVASVNDPTGLAFDRVGNLYVSSWGDGQVYKYSPAGNLLGPVWTAQSSDSLPYGLAVDGDDNLYIAGFGDYYSHSGKVFKVTPAGVSSTFVDAAPLHSPSSLVFDTWGNLYVSYYDSLKILCIPPNGSSYVVFAGGGIADDAANGLAINQTGELFVAVNGGRTTPYPAVLKLLGLVPSTGTCF